MHVNEHLYILDSVGVTILRSALDPDIVTEISTIARMLTEGTDVGKFPFLDQSPVFMDLLSHPWTIQICKIILGDTFRFDHAFGLQQPGSGVNPNLHGGPQTCQGASFYHGSLAVPRGHSIGRISVGFTLTHQSIQTGGFSFIPGSHKSSWPMHGREVLNSVLTDGLDSEFVLTPDLSPGDIILFPDCLVHGTRPWKGREPRRALYFMYSPGFMAWRPYSEIAKFAALARTDVQKSLFRPPYVASFEDGDKVVTDNRWRPTL